MGAGHQALLMKGESNSSFSQVGLLLHGNTDLTDSSSSNKAVTPVRGDILDSSGTPKTITVIGNTFISADQKKFGNASALFDGNDDALSIADSADWDFGTGDFTIELWARFASHTSIMTLVGNYQNSTTGWSFQRRSDTGTIRFGNGDTALIDVSWTPTDGVWYHIAVCRSGTSLRVFVDGTQVGSTATNSTNISGSTNPLLIGNLYLGSYLQDCNGYLDDIRITKGVARYTSNFTAPTSAHPDSVGEDSNYGSVVLLLHCNFSFSRTTQYKYGGGSLYFNGASYIYTPGHTDFDFGSGDFTIEFWIRYTGTNDGIVRAIVNRKQGILGYSPFIIDITGTGISANFSITGSSWTGFLSGATITPNTWSHVAVVRSGTSAMLFLDGVLITTSSLSGSLMSTSENLIFGAWDSSSNYLTAWLDDIRITKGLARYTTTFTPPAAEFPNS